MLRHKETGQYLTGRIFKRKGDAQQSINKSIFIRINKNACPPYEFEVARIEVDLTHSDKLNIRPKWEDYFIGLATLASKRSHDAQTQHGCVIADSKNRIIGIGYNGFPRGMSDATLPNKRPDKYDWMIHAEVNAVNNCLLKPEGAIAYVTGEPCNGCLMHMWQNGITKVIYRDKLGSKLIDDKMRANREIFLYQTGMIIRAVAADLSWMS